MFQSGSKRRGKKRRKKKAKAVGSLYGSIILPVWNYWLFGLLHLPVSYKIKKHDVSETGSVSVLR
jgi:hypothetical protein